MKTKRLNVKYNPIEGYADPRAEGFGWKFLPRLPKVGTIVLVQGWGKERFVVAERVRKTTLPHDDITYYFVTLKGAIIIYPEAWSYIPKAVK